MKFRNNGAIGALLDEYEKSIDALIVVIENISEVDLAVIVDPDTDDKDCRSIQTILSHVVESGYSYVIEIRKWLGETLTYKKKDTYKSVQEYQKALRQMFSYNELLFQDYPDITLEEYNSDKKITVRWGQQYDVDQLIEHAIVHILRHRRQIERFKIKLENRQ